jgi:hypothetical protein
MEHGPTWDGNSCSAGQQIPCYLRNPKVHYRVHNSWNCSVFWSRLYKPISSDPVYLPPILMLPSDLQLYTTLFWFQFSVWKLQVLLYSVLIWLWTYNVGLSPNKFYQLLRRFSSSSNNVLQTHPDQLLQCYNSSSNGVSPNTSGSAAITLQFH